MIRLFVGIEIPQDLRSRMAALAMPIEGARWVPEENLHITVRFIGEVPEDVAEDLAGALQRVRAQPFAISLAGAGHFESGRRVRTLWFGVERNDALAALYEKVESALVRVGQPPEGRRFKPHVTAARLRDVRPASVRNWLVANSMFRALPFQVERFVLFSSHVGRNGSIYTPEVAFPLEAR